MRKGQLVFLAMAGAAIVSLSSCGNGKKAAGSSVNSAIESAQWKLESMNGKADAAFTEGDSFTVEFLPQESKIAGKGACNRFFGQYSLAKKGEIDIKMGGATMMACPNLDLEQPYFNMLDGADKYKIEKGKLLFYKEGKVIATFKKSVKNR